MTNEEKILDIAEELVKIKSDLKKLEDDKKRLFDSVAEQSKDLQKQMVRLEENNQKMLDEILSLWPDREQKNVKGRGMTVTRTNRKKVFIEKSERGLIEGIRGLGRIMKNADIDLERKEIGFTVDGDVIDQGKVMVEEKAGIKIRKGRK